MAVVKNMKRFCWTTTLLFSLFLLGIPRPASANWVAGISSINGEADDFIFYPNWTKAYAAAFQLADSWISAGTSVGCSWCHPLAGDGCGGALLQVSVLTLSNFGTAVAGTDITNVYWVGDAAALTWHTMTPVGPRMWTWQWNNVEVNPTLLEAAPLVGQIRIYIDIAPTPTDGATIKMGIPYDSVGYVGGLYDMWCSNLSWADVVNPVPKTIKYVAKFANKKEAAPGDTITYTIYYGKPGTGNIQNVQILDTLPPYTHWNEIASVVPDPGWDPNWGIPNRMKWTVFPVSTPIAGGGTAAITFQLTVDWGNGESFEPGSGNVAGPENYILWNSARGTFPNIAAQEHYSNKTSTTVVRFLFWKLGDRDIVYNNTPSAVDEITYSIFVKNLSASKTWWKVSIWDTVPDQLNPWGPDCGFEDPCAGWTMTPTGCAPAYAGWRPSGGKALLTWRLDMPPFMTLTLRWKAKVAPFANAGQTCINKASILELGTINIVDGTGHSTTPRNFTHKAKVMLRTTYVSYVANNVPSSGVAYYIALYPLHPSSAFQLFRLRETECLEGTRPSITTPAPATPCNSWPGPGCLVGIERRPALYNSAVAGAFDYYKLVSNAPLLWEVEPLTMSTDEDSHMYSTTTTLSYRGNTSYTYRRFCDAQDNTNNGDSLGIINTENQLTTIHAFLWDDIGAEWLYQQSRTISPMSQWMTAGVGSSQDGHWRIISSDSDLIVWKGYVLGTDADNYCTMAPDMAGNLIGADAGDIFWVYAGQWASGATSHHAITLTNMGTATATFKIWKYMADEMFDLAWAGIPGNLGGSSGTWTPFLMDDIPPGIGAASPFNPYYFSSHGFSGEPVGCFNKSNFTDTFELIQVELVSSGQAVQIRAGPGAPVAYGGYVYHGINAAREPAQTAWEWWHNNNGSVDNRGWTSQVAFCPSKDMYVQLNTEEVDPYAFSATYVTTGPDQPVVHCPGYPGGHVESPSISCGTNYRWRLVAPTQAGKSMIGVVCGKNSTERGFSAPFLSTGTHYEILLPSVTFVGQNIWITVVVLEQGGATKCDYGGITSFSSTDPAAKIESVAMDTYSYDWIGGVANECGIKMFFNVKFNRLGLVNIIASDTMDGSITGMATIMVVGADVKLEKRQKLSVASSGDTVRFQICWSNFSTATAYFFTISDAIPRGTTYVPELSDLALCGWKGPFAPTVFMAASTSVTTTPPTNYSTVPSGSAPAGGDATRWLRWTVNDVYVNSTGCVCFKVVVN